MANTSIDWTDKVWNPTTGCTKGCSYCYARKMAHRLKRIGQAKYSGGFAPACHPAELSKPLHWRKPCRVFVNSMGDLFDPAIPDDFIRQVIEVIASTPHLTYQILTKFSARMENFFQEVTPAHEIDNLWVGVTIENQFTFKRWWDLYYANVAHRFISFEPLTGPIRFDCIHCHGKGHYDDNFNTPCPVCKEAGTTMDRIDWVICGGGTGSKASAMSVSWVRHLRDECVSNNIPFFFKQWGEWAPSILEVVEGSVNHTNGRYWPVFDRTCQGVMRKIKATSMIDSAWWRQFPETAR